MYIMVQHVNSVTRCEYVTRCNKAVTFVKGEPAVACTCVVVIMLKYETMARQL